MFVYLAPFLYIASMLAVYLYAPEERRVVAQKNIRTEPNFYLICGVILTFLSIFGYRSAYYGSWWLAALTWLVAIIMIVVSARKALEPPPADDKDEHLSL